MKHLFLFVSFLLLWSFSLAQNYTAEVLHYDTKVEFVGEKLIKTYHISIQINNSDGLNYAYIEIPKNSFEEINNIKASITDKNAKLIRKLKKKEIVFKSDISSGSFYENDFKYSFEMIHKDFPYILNYSYQSVQKEFIFIHSWRPNFYFNIPTLESNLTLVLPSTYEVLIQEKQIQHSKSVVEEGKNKYHWSGVKYLPYRKESYMPSVFEVFPRVAIIPKDFVYEIPGTHNDWQSFGKFVASLHSGLNVLPESEEYKIDALIKGVEEDKEKIDILYQYLQDETRYVDVSIDIGGMKSHPASYVAENKYGDCKALSNYFKSILEYVGIEAYFALIQSSDKLNSIDFSFPTSQFNHMILYVPLEKDSLWIDCTSDLSCGYVGSQIQGRDALIINGEESYFKKTKALTKKDVQYSRTFYINKGIGISANVNIRSSYKGRKYEILHQIKNDFEKSLKMELLTDYFVEDMVLPPDEITFITSDSNGEIILDYQTSSDIILQDMGKETMVRIPKTSFPQLEKPKYRDYDLQINYPIYQLDHIVFEKPLSGEIVSVPSSSEVRSDFGEYLVEVSENEKHIIVDKSFYLKAGKYSLDQYLDIYQFIDQCKKKERQLLIILND